jgi:hypothetical protein
MTAATALTTHAIRVCRGGGRSAMAAFYFRAQRRQGRHGDCAESTPFTILGNRRSVPSSLGDPDPRDFH